MLDFNPAVGQPIRNIQTYLRKIAYTYKDIPLVVPDGIYGEQTRNAVLGFQNKFGLILTGEVGSEDWDKIVSVYFEIMDSESEPRCINIYPTSDFIINPDDTSIHLYPIQTILFLLSQKFTHLGTLDINGIHDEKSVLVVKNLQEIVDMEQNGVIDKHFWNMVAPLYEVHISKDKKKNN